MHVATRGYRTRADANREDDGTISWKGIDPYRAAEAQHPYVYELSKKASKKLRDKPFGKAGNLAGAVYDSFIDWLRYANGESEDFMGDVADNIKGAVQGEMKDKMLKKIKNSKASKAIKKY